GVAALRERDGGDLGGGAVLLVLEPLPVGVLRLRVLRGRARGAGHPGAGGAGGRDHPRRARRGGEGAAPPAPLLPVGHHRWRRERQPARQLCGRALRALDDRVRAGLFAGGAAPRDAHLPEARLCLTTRPPRGGASWRSTGRWHWPPWRWSPYAC